LQIFQRSRSKWLKKDDANTDYSCVKMRPPLFYITLAHSNTFGRLPLILILYKKAKTRRFHIRKKHIKKAKT